MVGKRVQQVKHWCLVCGTHHTMGEGGPKGKRPWRELEKAPGPFGGYHYGEHSIPLGDIKVAPAGEESPPAGKAGWACHSGWQVAVNHRKRPRLSGGAACA